MNTPRMMARAPVITQEIDGRSHSEKHNEGGTMSFVTPTP